MKYLGLRVFLTLLCALLLSVTPMASDNKAARAIIVKGDVKFSLDGKTEDLKRNMWLPEGAQVETQKGSFAKLLFIDKSSINVGPDSKMKIETFPKDKAGIISLVKGKIRSKVTKNYMDNTETNKSKLFVKTKTAAMGVRGTDFQVSFNEENTATSLVTFEGAVAMGQINGDLGGFDQSKLEGIVSSDQAVMVRRGQFSGASPKQDKVTAPTKISPVQLETLQKNEVPGMNTSAKASGGNGASNTPAAQVAKGPSKKYRSVVPPGMDAKAVANTSNSLASAISKVAGPENAPAPVSAPALTEAPAADAPKAGGFIDIDNALYIPPPPGSTFDANAGVYVPPADVGHVDPATGNYTNDFYNLNPDGSFTLKEDEGGRSIASVDDTPPPEPPKTFDANNPTGDFDLALNDSSTGDNLIDPDLINQITQENTQNIDDFQNSDNNQIFAPETSTSTKVNVRPVVE